MTIRINESEYDLENGKKGKLAIFLYSGPSDPKPELDKAIRIYVDNNDYYEFVYAQLNCPWIRFVMSNINDMKQDTFDNFMIKFERKKKLDKINEISK